MTETVRVPGIKAPAEILVDRRGVPHIYAKSEADVFFLQGFNAARDRLFQIDLWRRRGLGQLSEVFGKAFVEQDKASRLFLYRGSMDREWRAYSSRGTSEAKDITRNFVSGINAYVDWLSSNPDRMPMEFKQLGYKPAKWAPEDVVRIRSDFRQQNGPSFRVVVDVGNWDNSRAVNHPGQSGDPDSPHYRDLAQMWRDGKYFPLLYSRKAIEEAAEKIIRIEPAQKK